MDSVFKTLSIIEKTFIWCFTCIASCFPYYVSYNLRRTYKEHSSSSDDDIPGDYEYDAWRKYAVLLAGMNVVYLVSCHFVRRHLPEGYHKPFRLAIGLVMILSVLSINATALILAYVVLLFVLVVSTKSKIVIWMSILFSIYVTQNNELIRIPFQFFGVKGKYKAICKLCLCLTYLRCVDFGYDAVQEEYVNVSKETNEMADDDEPESKTTEQSVLQRNS